jgi:hypothetical protein
MFLGFCGFFVTLHVFLFLVRFRFFFFLYIAGVPRGVLHFL